MAEIAARADARIGSLYRFFPSKEAIGDALADGYTTILSDVFAGLMDWARARTSDEVADRLIDQLVLLYPQIRAVRALLDSRTDWTELRQRFRAEALAGISRILKACAPGLGDEVAQDTAIVVFGNMRTMLGMIKDGGPTSPGAPEELKLMNRLYLAARLSSNTATTDRDVTNQATPPRDKPLKTARRKEASLTARVRP